MSSINSGKKKHSTDQQKHTIIDTILKQSKDGIPKIRSIKEVASSFSISTRIVICILQHARFSTANNLSIDVSSKALRKRGREAILLDPEKVRNIPLCCRTNIRSMSMALGMEKSTLHRRVKEGAIRSHSNAIKPELIAENMKSRLHFCLSMIDPGTISTNPMFMDTYNHIHIDEKLFFMTKTSEKFYLLPEENDPLCTGKSKKFITKLMFIAAVARPRYDGSSNEEFFGKIGIFPFIYNEPAKRRSTNREVGTLQINPITSVTKKVIRVFLINNLLPAIQAKRPNSDTRKQIFIQQDNVKPHIHANYVEFLEAASKDGFGIQLSFQPPNSPDLNVLELGFFRAIQSLQHQEAPKNIDELVTAIEKSFDEFPVEKLNHVFFTLQMCMTEVMKSNGSNKYKVPHMNKSQLERNGYLPK
ncbi:hypothetical protein ACH5RR_021654 [Cinchona calisaya]|uniref:Transposase n=1 Tax=Cinchona calisaya TaxID=153742 RepID=A0ABD2ZHX4_9GENT